MADSPFFRTRGVVIGVRDMQTLDWPQRAKDAGLSTIATHVFPQEVADFMATDAGQSFLARCAELSIELEHELHAMSDLLPRRLYDTTRHVPHGRGRQSCARGQPVRPLAGGPIWLPSGSPLSRLLPATTGRHLPAR